MPFCVCVCFCFSRVSLMFSMNFQVSPQFQNTICTSPYSKASRHRKKRKRRNLKDNEASTNGQVSTKQLLPALAFLSGKESLRGTSCSNRGTVRRSQRLQEKKRPHFLFEKTDAWTPSKYTEMRILACETPEHDLPLNRVNCQTHLQPKSQAPPIRFEIPL